jgi:uncharacterized hydrophobic protein (TIGR00271 family)
MLKKTFFKVSEERKQQIITEVSDGSVPGFRFYALLATASLIAAFGLISNSTAVIIGAMLVSPLMTPIIGMSLGFVIGMPHLVATSTRSVVLGVVLAIFFAALIGFLPLELAATPEMLSRTKPTILDLMVAVLAGFAGAYAMIDEKLSPALPGVAIATAIVPPLSNAGICLAFGAYAGAFGSFMLFFANFLSILLVAGATFMLSGLSPGGFSTSTKDLAKRYGVAIVGFIAVAVFLTYSLVGIVKERYLENTIKTTLDNAILRLHSSSLDSFIYDKENGQLYVLANIKTPRIVTPFEVENVEKELEENTGQPAELIVRNVLSKDVGAIGSTANVVTQNLDGFFLKESLSEKDRSVSVAEQLLMEKLSDWPGMSILNAEYVVLPRGPSVLATIQGYRNLTEKEIGDLEAELRNDMNDPNISLIVRYVETSYFDKNGELLPGYKYADIVDPGQIKLRNSIELELAERFDKFDNIYLITTHHKPGDNEWGVLVEVVGSKFLTSEEIRDMQNSVSKEVGKPVKIDVLYRSNAVITDKGLVPYEKFSEKNVTDLDEMLKREGVDKIDSEAQTQP